MSTFTFTPKIPGGGPEVEVNLPPSLSKEQLLSFPAFKTWIERLQHSLSLQDQDSHTFASQPYRLRRIDVQAVDFFGGSRLGFVKLKADVSNEDGETLPGSVFLRGGSVAMMLILQPDDTPLDTETDKYVILTVQPRIPAGSLGFTELPAGMLDDSGTFAGAAAKEINEETGLEIKESELINMTELALSKSTDGGETLESAVYPSCGGCDEFIPVFLWQKRVPRATLRDWEGKLTGLRESGEKISLTLSRLENLWKDAGRDGKALAGYALYQGLKQEHKI